MPGYRNGAADILLKIHKSVGFIYRAGPSSYNLFHRWTFMPRSDSIPDPDRHFFRQHGVYWICTDPARIDFEAVYDFLSQAPWASGLDRAAMAEALANSLCFALFDQEQQVGLARVITDFVTYAYLCDVYVRAEWRGLGLGSWLVRSVLEHPRIGSLRRVALITHDAQDFYLRLGFQLPVQANHYLERVLTQS